MNGSTGMDLLHHVAIQTRDLRNCVSWYRAFLDLREIWTTETFSELTLRRLPGIVRLTEVASNGLRLHIFELADGADGDRHPRSSQFQHVCLVAASDKKLRSIRRRWIELFESGRFHFALQQYPTEIAVDENGTESFYCLDVDGLELEFSYEPRGEP